MLALALLEIGLRVGGFGYPTEFLIPIEGQDAHTTNDRFSRRFFPPTMARVPTPCHVPEKAPGTYRIFVLGGSAAQGTPDATKGVSRVLEVMLNAMYPETKFEVFDAAVTAINSHVVRLIAMDCAGHGPDLFVVYMGNNEVIGPFGPGTIFKAHSPNLTLIRAGLAARRWRVGQLFDELGRRFGSGGGGGRWRGMQALAENPIGADDPRLEAVYRHFRRNVVDICGAADRAGASLLLSTVITNLKDCPPFASVRSKSLTEEQAAQWQQLVDQGIEQEEAGRHRAALDLYIQAGKIDDGHAELAFRIGRCRQALGDTDAARDAFIRARDFDALRFRCDSRLNRIVREVADERQAHLVDAEASVNEAAIAGRELLHEHVHLTFDGNYRLARLLVEGLNAILPESILGAASGPEPPERDECARMLALTIPDRHRNAQIMLGMVQDVPFTHQLDHEADVSRRRRELDLLAASITPKELDRACAAYRELLAKRPDDFSLRMNLARLEKQRENYAASQEQYRWLAQRTGPKVAWTLPLANIQMDQADHVAAVELFRQALAMNPYHYGARNGLAGALGAAGRADEAIPMLRRLLEEEPDFTNARHNLAALLAKQGRTDDAILEYRKWIEHDPDRTEPRTKLGDLFAAEGALDKAVEQYEAALQIAPSSAVHGKVAQLSFKLKRWAPAVAHLQAVRRIRGSSVEIDTRLAWVLATAPDATVRHGAEAVRMMEQLDKQSGSQNATVLTTLAAAYAETGQFEKAVDAAERALPLAANAGQTGQVRALRGHIERYRQGRSLVP